MLWLNQGFDRAYIIAYQEDTTSLETALQQEKIRPIVLRQTADPALAETSGSYRCLLNHHRAWQTIAASGMPGLIVEADFVPVQGMGQLPIPYPWQHAETGVAWLYTCAPQIYHISEEGSTIGYAEGFSCSTVAYLVTPPAATQLLDLLDWVRSQFGTQYSAWDSQLEGFLRQRGLKSYIPFRNYGEHGGVPNPEHRQHGLSSFHRADVLYGKLAFKPDYAQGDHGWKTRLQARCKGFARLLMGKYLRSQILRRSSTPQRLLQFALLRQATLRL
ncbi:MAG: hypothetical protein VKJ24_19495 [Synechococcales bacterium]|nr:hypothetical protein [Synechococcales bacterium]